MPNSRRCVVCIIDFHRASSAKRSRTKKHLENITQDDIIIPEWLFKEEQEPVRDFIKKNCS